MNGTRLGAMVLGAALLAACGLERAQKGVAAGEPARDSIVLDAADPRLKFLKIEELKPTDAAPSVVLSGRLAVDEDHTQRVATPIDGRAIAVLVKPGDRVKAGQALIELSSSQVGSMQADAQKAQHDLQLAQKTVDRAHKLREDGAVSEKEVAQSESELQKTKVEVGRTAAQLRSIGILAGAPATSVSLRAQIAGTVIERNVLLGQEVRADATTPLLTITNLENLWAIADVYEQDLALVASGALVTVRVPAYPGETFQGTVTHLGDVVDRVSRTVKLVCALPNPTGKLKPEMFARVELVEAAGKQVLVIPTKALLTGAGVPRVIVAEGPLLSVQPVEVGPERDGRLRVLGGLKSGDRIVTEGALFLSQEIGSR